MNRTDDPERRSGERILRVPQARRSQLRPARGWKLAV